MSYILGEKLQGTELRKNVEKDYKLITQLSFSFLLWCQAEIKVGEKPYMFFLSCEEREAEMTWKAAGEVRMNLLEWR